MQWGSYLTNGVVKGSYCNDEEKRENVFVSFEKYFLKEGLSQFNARIATGFIKVLIIYLIFTVIKRRIMSIRTLMKCVAWCNSCIIGKSHRFAFKINQFCRINKIPISPSNVLQVGCPTIVPQLRSIPIWDTSLFDWVATLEAQYPAILAEFQALRGVGNHFQVHCAPICAFFYAI